MAKNKRIKPIETNEKLARIVAVGFEEIHVEINQLNKKIDGLADHMNQKFDDVNVRMDRSFKQVFAAVAAVH